MGRQDKLLDALVMARKLREESLQRKDSNAVGAGYCGGYGIGGFREP
jgi:hypothetical protein